MVPLALQQVSTNVDDVDAALRFYVDLLGLAERDDQPNSGFPGAWLDAGAQQLHLVGGAVPVATTA